MNLDKNTVLAFLLVGLIVIGFSFFQSVEEVPVEDQIVTEEVLESDETITEDIEAQSNKAPAPVLDAFTKKDPSIEGMPADTTSSLLEDSEGNPVAAGATDGESLLGEPGTARIVTDKYIAYISSKGASLKKFFLTEYTFWDPQYQSQLVWSDQGSLFYEFNTHSGSFDSRTVDFVMDTLGTVELSGDQEYKLNGYLRTADGGEFRVTYTFKNGKYDFDLESQISNMSDLVTNNGFSLVWDEGLRYQEMNSVDESGEARAFFVVDGEETEIDADDDEPVMESIKGNVDYAAIKTKYFLLAINPYEFDGRVQLDGNNRMVANDGMIEKYGIRFSKPYKTSTITDKYNIYLGPIDFAVLEEYGYDEAVEFGWGFIGSIGRYLMMPLFNFIHAFVPSWGWTIIIFSVLIKIILYPLSRKQMQSTQKTKLLAPLMTELNEKYKDDPTRRQQEMMKLYSEYGVNPAGGCLPMLLQMPIFFALWAVLRSNIAIRGADFLWITDLANPEYILDWGFPILGISGLSGLALLTGFSMFFMQKMTITDPRQKQMVYIMPVMFTFLFSGFPAGINLYYLVFNILSIFQQWYQNNHSKSKVSLEDLKNAPKKEGWLTKKMAEAQKMAESQGRVPKGTYTGKGSDQNNIKNRGTQQRKKKKK